MVLCDGFSTDLGLYIYIHAYIMHVLLYVHVQIYIDAHAFVDEVYDEVHAMALNLSGT